ncbi:SusC/RagA family TonB-linked outer membrane protein [Mucilaginibacter flavidus]|uniref:SusC/RagA family TonB-linked outer membrane protein n=1 Tax=Mucilaginibacter flavidus TaxID=2949309 RepID=UPI00209228EE|nr:TonB-dependent receptor [Mucilaginibacter flavidus]MCO5946424.1 TonB-dependent receptor [Mucilaginibacter flavidus]
MKKKYLLSTFIRLTAILVIICINSINYTFAANDPAHLRHLNPDAAKSDLSKVITGKVTDEDGLPLPGVTVRIKGTSTAVGTDVSGAFRIEVPNEQAVLVFSFVGYASKDEAVSGKSVINVALKSDSKSLNEVVVVGYGTQKRANVTGAVSSVSGKTLTELPVSGVDQALQGRVAGLTVTNNGSPGTAPVVQVRGVSSIGYGGDPLYIIDGVAGSIGGLDAQEIQSVDVLKDASSAAIYGSRGTNGVILITTKKGSRNNKAQVSISSYGGFQQVTKRYDLLNTNQYLQYERALDGSAGIGLPPRLQSANFNLPIYAGSTQTFAQTNTDWQSAYFQKGAIQQHDVTISGGNDVSRFFTSGGYFDQDGITVGTFYTRKNFRMNSDHNVNKFVTIGETFNVSSTRQRFGIPPGNRTPLTNVIRMQPYIPVYNPNNQGGYFGPQNSFDGADPVNPVEQALINDNRNYGFGIHGNLFLTVKFTPWLKFNSTYGIDYGTNRQEQYTPIYNDGGTSSSPLASITENVGSGTTTLYTEQLTFDKTFAKKHHVSAVAVYEAQTNRGDSHNSFGNQNNNTIKTLQNATNITTNYTYGTNVLTSYVGRVSYDYAGKYLLSGSVRQDGLSVWAPGHKYEWFPAASVGWKVDQEDFMKGMTSISELKLRAGYGRTGINGTVLGNYPYVSNVSAGGTTYPFNNLATGANQGNGSYYGGLSNPQLHWEITNSTNIGVDLGLFQNAFTLSAEVYDRKTDNLILGVPVPPSYGVGGPLANVGSMDNKGIELTAGYHKTAGDFRYDITGVFSLDRNKVTSLTGSANGSISAGQDADFGNGVITNTVPGQSIQYFYGYVVEGIFQSASDVSGHATQTNAAPGDIKFKDVNQDGVIDARDRVNLGSYLPKFSYSLNYSASYKNFDMTAFFQGVYGNKIFNAEKVILEGMARLFNSDVHVLNAWTPSNTNTNIPRAISGDPNSNLRVSSRWIESGSYLRLKNLQIGYSFPTGWLKNATDNNVSKVRIYLSGANIFTVTKYTGLDPEVGSKNGTLTNGIDYGQYPQPRTLLVGLQATF